MKDKMRRFLNSIQIENIEDFDLDFDSITHNVFNYNQVDMVLRKEHPWEYIYLDKFINQLECIKYPYSIKFSYASKISVYDAIKLFDDWYFNHYHHDKDFALDPNGDAIIFVFTSSEQETNNQMMMSEFAEFLKFINYQFNITTRIETQAKEVEQIKVSEKELKKLEKKANKIIEKNNMLEATNEDSYFDKESAREEINNQELRNFENEYLKQMEENYQRMLRERQMKKAWKKGDYVHYENISDITEKAENVDINGELFSLEKPRKASNSNKISRRGLIGLNQSAINIRIVESGKTLNKEFIKNLEDGMNVRFRGALTKDRYSNELVLLAHYIDVLPKEYHRHDEEKNKRVELHLHTKMSAMDGVSDIATYCEAAKEMGHKAIAVTDHGVIQVYPAAQKAAKDYGLKMLYGAELYMVDDELPFGLNPSPVELMKADYIIFDLETTGLSARYDRITEFAAFRIEKGNVVDQLDLLINPGIQIPEKIVQKTHITNEMVKDKPRIEDVIDQIMNFIGEAIIVSHNINFDIGFMNEALNRLNRPQIKNPLIDTLSLSRYLFPDAKRHTLGALSRNLEIASYNEEEAHRADFDARILTEVWQNMLPRLILKNKYFRHDELSSLKASDIMVRHMKPSHVTVLVKKEEGLKDLYEMISLSHIDFLADVPKLPRRILANKRKNLLVGSACFNGELFECARTRSRSVLLEQAKFYDYIEIQPLDNYSYLLDTGSLNNLDELKRILFDIIDVANELNIPVVATGDCHYANQEDKIIRDIYISAYGVGNVAHPLNNNPYKREDIKIVDSPNQHYRSTTEMLEAMAFLGEEKAEEYVIKNTNKIADMIDVIKPIKDDLHIPFFENSPEILTEETFKRAKELYGDPLPEVIEARLNRELRGIIDNGYSVTYYIARKIIEKANNDGYIVGSRGSVGSSLVASMFGITEVNPLAPHYRCPKCRHFEFSTNKEYRSGFDLPEKLCPLCGEKMIIDGQNIPFETFLGFNADKIPDIDLNFPSDYQSRAHDYTKVLLGEHNVFRAGTIETVQNKTAYGYVRGYYERHGINPDTIKRADISYLAYRATDVKRTTGQHPGGIMVVPQGDTIYNFSPIQYPANDKENTWFTTHFDYRALHDSLLKLDLLGHVDPLALKLMSELTHVSIDSIPLNDKKVLSIFSSDKALERVGNYLNVETGAMGIPEFGTDFVQGILIDSRPKTFSDLIIISALSHGTEVWDGNAEALIKSKQCTLNEVIGCRDDIMTYLIDKGLDNKIAFSIMEDVRKGRGVKEEFENIMKAHNVPDWYIDSCNKIAYMFPKAHAVAYVTQAVRVGYFKVYYPLEFYAIWFSVRCKQYDAKALLGGVDTITTRYDELRRKKNNREKLSPKETEIMKSLTMAIEMTERGYRFSNVDLYRSEASNFVVDQEHKALIMPFIVVDGLGENAADSVIEARKDGKFTSQEDLLKRTKLNNTNVKDLVELGALIDLGETDQISLFDFEF